MSNLKRNLAVIGSTAVFATLGLGGAMAANASPSHTSGHAVVQKAASTEQGETADGPNVGVDASATEPGHQDASDTGDAADSADTADGADAADGAESSASDGPDQGVDANPSEPGHQDVNDAADATSSK